jgi:hypothetical protein
MKMKSKPIHWARLSLMAMTLILANGCWLVVAGAGAGAGAAWYYGALRSTEETGHTALYEASKQALTELNIPIHKDSVDATGATIEGRTADDKLVHISVKRLTDHTSDLITRVGITDEPRARMIYEKIGSNLSGV